MRPDFRKPSPAPSEIWYDPEYDQELIRQSIAKQYHIIPSAQGDLKYRDWAEMVSGLMEDTPLGQIVRIRMEKDPSMLKNFTEHERQIRGEWAQFLAQKALCDPLYQKAQDKKFLDLERTLASLFEGVNYGKR